MKQLLFILLLFSCVSVNAQKQGKARIDSLLQELPKLKEDTGKVKLLCTLSSSMSNTSPEEGIKYAQQSIKLSTALRWPKGLAVSHKAVADNYITLDEYSKSM